MKYEDILTDPENCVFIESLSVKSEEDLKTRLNQLSEHVRTGYASFTYEHVYLALHSKSLRIRI